ncbi:response regulator [Candidatus Uabimicrobium sp. HlEnr_7]|uniref:response regulator n=1 Tax=Candidatus Uabimicrobium helgolandensis TaxID=3095367 RepID=UPI00355698BE
MTTSVLVVEGDEEDLHYPADILRAEQYRIRPVTSGNQALKSIEAKLPDIILLDINMPDISGYDVCRRLKSNENTKDIPVIFISGLTSLEEKNKGFSCGCVDFITKPFFKEGGTLFLDEIGDLSLDVQTMLLRTLEDGVIRPVGSEVNRQINVRIIAATNNNLQKPTYITPLMYCVNYKKQELLLKKEHGVGATAYPDSYSCQLFCLLI